MKEQTLEEWEEKYIVDDVKRFDEKYQMFLRCMWDAEIHKQLEDWSFRERVEEEGGYTLEDRALNNASGGAIILQNLGFDKPYLTQLGYMFNQMIGKKGSGSRRRTKMDAGDSARTTNVVKKAATWFGADLVGVCKMDKRWLYSHCVDPSPGMNLMRISSDLIDLESKPLELSEDYQYAIVTANEMDYELMKYVPSTLGGTATTDGYSRIALTNHYLTAFIKNLGYDVIDCSINQFVLNVPMAMQAGLGDIARNGLLVTRKYGCRVRLNVLFTNLPLVPDKPIEFGVTEFCKSCEFCANKCPSQAICYGERTSEVPTESNVGGVLKWPVDGIKCRKYWGTVNKMCALCITVCPFNKPDTAFHRFVRWCTDHARWADPLYIKADQWMGYGKPKKADNFWEEWQPEKSRRMKV